MTDHSTRPDLPYGRQLVDDDDVSAVIEVLRGDWLTTGPPVAAFEKELAERIGSHFAISCASGTAGLHLAMLALEIESGDAVVVPTNTFLATANVVRYAGGEVIFADVDPDTGLLTAETLDEALNRCAPNTPKAVLPVHFSGQMADMEEISGRARKSGLSVAEDACHALGTSYCYNGAQRFVGSCDWSDMAVFSFHAVKTISTGEGGAVTTNDPAIAARLALLRNHGMTRDITQFTDEGLSKDAQGNANPWSYEQSSLGLNYRLSGIQCALGRSQLSKLDGFVERRRNLVARYDQLLNSMSNVVKPIRRTALSDAAWHLYVVLIDFASIGTDRATVMRKLADRGITTQVHYIPVHRQPYYRQRYGVINLSGSSAYYKRTLTLPLFPGMADQDVDRVIEALSEAIGTA